MKCVKCGSELKPGARFCSKCGAVTGQASKQAPGKMKPVEKRPVPAPGGNLDGGRMTPPGPGGEKKRTPTALVVTLVVLLICLVLSIGGIAAYMMGAFDSFLPSSDSEVTRDYDDDDEEEEEEEVDELESESQERALSEGEAETETEGGLSGSGSLPTEAVTEAVTEPVTAAQTVAQPSTAAMPTLSGQGAANGLPTQAPTQGASNLPPSAYQDYILPESSTRLLTASDIAGLSKEQLRIARNEIYARHGRMFTTEELQQYFNSKSWYRGTISASSFSESMLSQIEKDNIKLIQERENALP